jgi:hypothetical protein
MSISSSQMIGSIIYGTFKKHTYIDNKSENIFIQAYLTQFIEELLTVLG